MKNKIDEQFASLYDKCCELFLEKYEKSGIISLPYEKFFYNFREFTLNFVRNYSLTMNEVKKLIGDDDAAKQR